MKKLFRFFRNCIVFSGWLFVFILITNTLISAIWSFDYLSVKSWQIFSNFWNSGGVLKTTSDILLLFTLLLLPVFFLFSFLWAKKQNYTKILLSPIVFFYNLFNSSNNKTPERILIKKSKKAQTAEDIKNEIESLKPQKSKKAGDIRSQIIQKLTDEIIR